MTPLRLYVNIDHVATVRQARRTDEPDPVAAARAALAGGADGITVHLREDRRHIQDADVDRPRRHRSRPRSTSSWPPATRSWPSPAGSVPTRPRSCPSGARRSPPRGASASARGTPRLRAAIRRLDEAGCRVSLFIDPSLDVIDAAKDLGVPAVELHTGDYAHRWRDGGAALDAAPPRRHATRPTSAWPCTPAMDSPT